MAPPLTPNTVRSLRFPNLQYPQRLPSRWIAEVLSGLIEPSLHMSCHLPSPYTRKPYPPDDSLDLDTVFRIWHGEPRGRATQYPVLLSPFAKPYLFHFPPFPFPSASATAAVGAPRIPSQSRFTIGG